MHILSCKSRQHARALSPARAAAIWISLSDLMVITFQAESDYTLSRYGYTRIQAQQVAEFFSPASCRSR